MATSLKKRVVRETTMTYGQKRRLCMIALCPGDVVEVWTKGYHKKWEIPIGAIMDVAIKMEIASEKARKAAEKKAKKNG